MKGPFRPRPGYHPADPRNWQYTEREAIDAGLKSGPPQEIPHFSRDELRRRYLDSALKDLEELRKTKNPLIVKQLVSSLRFAIQNWGFLLSEIGTSEEELASFEKAKGDN